MAGRSIAWKASAAREVGKLSRHVVPRIIRAVEALADRPFPPGVRKLQAAQHAYRIRVGDYRVVYSVVPHAVIIEHVRHRREAYR